MFLLILISKIDHVKFKKYISKFSKVNTNYLTVFTRKDHKLEDEDTLFGKTPPDDEELLNKLFVVISFISSGGSSLTIGSHCSPVPNLCPSSMVVDEAEENLKNEALL